jgi:3-oxoacyl-[acyl-carrier-protein] synthase-3
MSSRSAFITGHGVFLPNAPVSNERIGDVLGTIGSSTKVMRRILLANGIRSRHYAVDPESRQQTHTNVQLTAEAIRALAANGGFSLDDLDCLVCGTSSPDQFIPSHGSMVHAEIGCPPCEVATTSGVCCSGMTALKYGYLNVASGAVENAIVTGSELASPSLMAEHFRPAMALFESEAAASPALGFATDFLRWMLSDGAGALLLTRRPRSRPSLRVDWLDLLSYAPESEVCMYSGMQKQRDGSTIGYRLVPNPRELSKGGFLNLSQDVAVLKDRLPALAAKAIEHIKNKRNLSAECIDWLLPHYSSEWFHQPLYEGLARLGLEIPADRWFTNLATKGNTGSASIYIILDELLSSTRLTTGQHLLCLVPESARMTFALLHLTVA